MISLSGVRVRAQVLACTLALSLVACSPAGDSTASADAGSQGDTFSPFGRSSISPLLGQIEKSLDTTAFRGIRRTREVRGADVLEQREDVGADGQGGFAIELVETLSMTPDFDQGAYEIFFESGSRFRWQVRDFRIQDLGLAALNYSMTETTSAPVVAGITCVTVELRRLNQGGMLPGIIDIDVDPSTGFVLACREMDEMGAVVFESIYESFAYGGDITDMTMRGRSFGSTQLDLTMPLDVQSGFATKFPDLLPPGFEVVTAEVMNVPAALASGGNSFLPTGDWLKLTATDGVEVIVFAHSSLPFQAQTRGASEFRVLAQGTWDIGYGNIAQTMFVIASRATTDEVRRLISSAL